MPVPEAARAYLLTALSAQPVIAQALLARTQDESEMWDVRPDPDRFSLREALAHLADWEPIWLERVRRFVSDDHPFLPSVDEGLLVIENAYATRSGSDSLTRYASGRKALVEYLRSASESDWDRMATREFVGEMSLYQQAAMILSHDGYHMNQIVEWLAS